MLSSGKASKKKEIKLRERLTALKGAEQTAANEKKRNFAEKELKRIREEVRTEVRRISKEARILATTISRLTADDLFEGKRYDVVIFDDISRAYVTQVLCAAMFAEKHLICVGDFRQHAPAARSEAKDVLEKDLFSFLRILVNGDVCAHPWLVMLDKQRGMRPEIFRYSDIYYYGGMLKGYETVWTGREDFAERSPLKGFPVNVVDLAGTNCFSMKDSDDSGCNIVSAVVSMSLALEAVNTGETSIGIITPYAAQTRLIQALLQDADPGQKWKDNISCKTVYQLQDHKKNLIIFDAAESFPAAQADWLLLFNENKALERLINTVLTRTARRIIFVVDSRFWTVKYRDRQNEFYHLLDYLLKWGKVMKIRSYGEYGYLEDSLTKGPVRAFSSQLYAMDLLKEDFLAACQRIIIPDPSAWGAVLQKEVLRWITDAKSRGVTVLTYALEPGSAVFPLAVFDDKAVWYGLPSNRGFFVDNGIRYAAPHSLRIRITGKETTDLIRSLRAAENPQ